jgi:deuterolysin
MEYDSNVIHSTVDGEAAALVRRDFQENLHKRFAVQSDCTGSSRTNTINAISNCRSLAQRAASVASSGSAAKMNEFFKSSTSATRNTVASTFNRIASQCSSSSSGAPQYCSDIHPSRPCSQNGVIAYCAGGSYVVNCPYYFSFPNHNTGCRSITQSSTTLHEATHLSSVKGTVDYCYGYSCIQSLSSSQNLNNADTYTLFAQSIHAGC